MKTCDGGQSYPSTEDAAAALAQGHAKSAPVAVKWGMKDQDSGAGKYKPPGVSNDPYEK